MTLPLRAPALLVMLAAFGLGGCSGGMFDAQNDAATPMSLSYPGLSPIAPPAPTEEAEQRPEDPRTQIWKPGYWSYDSGSFAWVPGELVARPSPTAVWFPEMWIRHDYGWAFVAGYWR